MNAITKTSATDLRKILSTSTLPPAVSAELEMSLNLVDLAASQFKTTRTLEQVESTQSNSAQEFHDKIKPYLRISNLLVTATEIFIASRSRIDSTTAEQFQNFFNSAISEIGTFNKGYLEKIDASNPNFGSSFTKHTKVGESLQILAIATYQGDQERPLSQTEFAKLRDVSTAAVTGIRDTLEKLQYIEEPQREELDRRKLTTKLAPLGWQALAYYEIKENNLKINAIETALTKGRENK